MIAQSLAAGQKTVPENFFPHSCHCYFLLAGSSEVPIIYHVERVRDGRSFATRTVQARQKGRCIFTITISFTNHSVLEGKKAPILSHARPFPEGEKPPTDEEVRQADVSGFTGAGPFQTYKAKRVGDGPPGTVKTHMWMRAKGSIKGGTFAHLEALAYVSDSYFMSTINRNHKIWRWPFAPEDVKDLPDNLRKTFNRWTEFEGVTWNVDDWKDAPSLGMQVSLDHSIYFHDPLKLRADQWMLHEMESPWAGNERGLVMQRIYSEDGTLLASCVQEGVTRLKQTEDSGKEEEDGKRTAAEKSRL